MIFNYIHLLDYLELSPWYGSILGGTPIQVTGPYYQDGSHISIAFDGGDAVNCTRIDSSKALCVSPRLQKIGPVPVNLYSNGNLLNTDAEATFYSSKFNIIIIIVIII